MKEFENPFDKFPLRAKPWAFLRREETSYIIYNAYRLHFLTSEDVKSFIRLHRQQQLMYYTFPLIAGLFINKAVWANHGMFRVLNKQVALRTTVGLTAFTWWVFSKFSPYRRGYENEKEKILNYLDANFGMAVLNFNNLLPRYWTESWVNGFTAQLYRRRNSRLTGILYAPEGAPGTIYAEDEYPVDSEVGY